MKSDKKITKNTNSSKTKNIARQNQQNKKACEGCTLCCTYVNFGIEEPQNKRALDEAIWFIMHKNVYIWVDKHDNWFFKFVTPCNNLKNGICTIYNDRPIMCKEYDNATCEKGNPTVDEIFSFHTKDDLLDYLKLKKNTEKIKKLNHKLKSKNKIVKKKK